MFNMRRKIHNIAGAIKEAAYIRVNDPFLNRNFGKFQLSHISLSGRYVVLHQQLGAKPFGARCHSLHMHYFHLWCV